MARRKKADMKVGSNNIVRSAIPKRLNKLIIEFQVELEKQHGKPVSKQWAALQLTIEMEKKRKK